MICLHVVHASFKPVLKNNAKCNFDNYYSFKCYIRRKIYEHNYVSAKDQSCHT